MSDIVERMTANLDKYPGFQNMNSEAAAEITRLRARLAAWKAEGETWRKWCDTEPEAVISEPLLWQDVVNARAATDAIEKNAS